MLKLTKTGIGLLTKQYRSVLRKCLLINVGLFVSTIFLLSSEQQDAWASITYENYDYILKLTTPSNYYTNNGIWIDDTSGQGVVRIIDDVASGGFMELISPNGQVSTALTTNYFRLNNSSTVATGIDSNAIQNSTALITSGGVYDALNYYYTKTEADARYVLKGLDTGNVSVAIGTNSQAIDSGDISIGYGARSSEYSSISIGDYSNASAVFSVAVGMHALASGYSSVALGRYSTANESNVISVGHLAGDKTFDEEETYSSDYFRRIVNVAEGSGANDAVTVSQLGNIAAGTKILNANGENAISFGTGSGQTTVGTALSTLANQLYNYYYTKTEADARYALLDTIGDVDYSDEAADEGSALKNGAEDSPTTVRGALDLLDTKIGSLNETGIAGDDVATQLKYILENGSTGGAGVTLSTLGYIGENTPYLNTTSNAMNFSSTYTIGGNMATLANQIKTNETNIDNLSSRINSLSTYTGTLDLTDNYAKVIGDVNLSTNQAGLTQDGNYTKAYATPNKSYTVEFAANLNNGTDPYRYFRVQVAANNEADALAKAKEKIINGWSDAPHSRTINNQTWNTIRDNKYIYDSGFGEAIGYNVENQITTINEIIQNLSTNDVSFTENNYTVEFGFTGAGGYYDMLVDVDADSPSEALDKAKELAKTGWYWSYDSGTWGDQYGNVYLTNNNASGDPDGRNTEIDSVTTADYNRLIEDGDKGYSFNGSSLLENVAILDAAIGDLGATGVSGASVAAQLKLLGEVGSEALGQKIGSWSTTKNSITQTLGEETKNYGYLTAFEYDSENEQYVGTVGDNLQALDSALSLTAKGLDALSHQLYNYYYTFRVDERDEVIDSASFFQKDFSTLQEVDLQSKNPTHLGAFTKCDEVCPRPSERFASSLSQEQMFKNNASVDAGTSRHCLRQFGDVVADLLRNTVARNMRIYEFMNEEVCHA